MAAPSLGTVYQAGSRLGQPPGSWRAAFPPPLLLVWFSQPSVPACTDPPPRSSEKTIWDWIYKGRRQPALDPIPYYKLGGLVRFNLGDIRAWVGRRKVRPPAIFG